MLLLLFYYFVFVYDRNALLYNFRFSLFKGMHSYIFLLYLSVIAF